MLEHFMRDFLAKSSISKQESMKHLRAGRCKDYADYKLVIGKIKGFEEAEDLARKVYTSMVSEEDFKHKEIKYKEISYVKEPESY